MLFLHEVHRLVGARQADFESAYRDWWAPMLVASGTGRLLWYLDQAHGAGPSYTVVTISAVVDGEAWQDLAERVRAGDLRDWAEAVDGLRRMTAATLLIPLPWSPLHPAGLDDLPDKMTQPDPPLYMEEPWTRYSHTPACSRTTPTRREPCTPQACASAGSSSSPALSVPHWVRDVEPR